MFATRIVVQGNGDGGTWHGIMVDAGRRIELADFGIQMGQVANPDPGDQNQLISLLSLTGPTTDIVGHDLFFGQAVGDGLRILGDASLVQNIRFTDFEMRMAGLGRGSRSGVALQRGWRGVELANFYIDGVKNSPIDMEPSGTTPMSHLNIHDGLIDQSLRQSEVVVSIAGSPQCERVKHVRVSDLTVLNGRLGIRKSEDVRLTNVTVVATSDLHGPLLLARDVNHQLRLEDLYLERSGGGAAGHLLDVENLGDWTNVDGGAFVQHAPAAALRFDGTRNLRVYGSRVEYRGPDPRKLDGIVVANVVGAADNVTIDQVTLGSTTGKLRSAIRFTARPRHSMRALRVTDMHSAGAAINGVYFSYHPDASADRSPVVAGLNNGADAVWKQVDRNDNVITSIFPVIAGNPGGVCQMVGHAAPEGLVAAVQGTIYIREAGDATARYYKVSGTGVTGWSGPLIAP